MCGFPLIVPSRVTISWLPLAEYPLPSCATVGVADQKDSFGVNVVLALDVGDQFAHVSRVVDRRVREVATRIGSVPKVVVKTILRAGWKQVEESSLIGFGLELEIRLFDRSSRGVPVKHHYERRRTGTIVTVGDIKVYGPIVTKSR